MKYMQKLGKAIMLPVACMPLCGILMGIGYLLCPASMQGGTPSGAIPVIGLFLVRAGGALIDHIALLFAVGVGVGMARDRDGAAGLAALVSWLVIITLLNAGFLRTVLPGLVSSDVRVQAFEKIENPFIGILAGLIGAACYNRFWNTRLPDWLAFFSGQRSAVIIAGFASVIVSGILLLVWPLVKNQPWSSVKLQCCHALPATVIAFSTPDLTEATGDKVLSTYESALLRFGLVTPISVSTSN